MTSTVSDTATTDQRSNAPTERERGGTTASFLTIATNQKLTFARLA